MGSFDEPAVNQASLVISHRSSVIGHRSDEIVSLTGGRAFFPSSLKQIDYYCDLIQTELRNQYVLGYTPNNAAHDGKWRKVKVHLDSPEGLPKLTVRAKTKRRHFRLRRN